MDVNATEAAAIREFPDLEFLMALRAAGWHGLPPVIAADEIVQIDGFRIWGNGWRDGIRIRDRNDVLGIRIDAEYPPGLVWELSGNLCEVATALLELPVPGHRLAPQLVIGRAPQLWTPSSH